MGYYHAMFFAKGLNKSVSVPYRGMGEFLQKQSVWSSELYRTVSVPSRGLGSFLPNMKKFILTFAKEFPSPREVWVDSYRSRKSI